MRQSIYDGRLAARGVGACLPRRQHRESSETAHRSRGPGADRGASRRAATGRPRRARLGRRPPAGLLPPRFVLAGPEHAADGPRRGHTPRVCAACSPRSPIPRTRRSSPGRTASTPRRLLQPAVRTGGDRPASGTGSSPRFRSTRSGTRCAPRASRPPRSRGRSPSALRSTRFVPETYSLDPNSDRLAPMREGTTPGLWQELERETTGRLSLRNYGSAPHHPRRHDGRHGRVRPGDPPAGSHRAPPDHDRFPPSTPMAGSRIAPGALSRPPTARSAPSATPRQGPASSTVPPSSSSATTASWTSTPRSCPTSGWPKPGCTGTEPDRGEWRATFHPDGRRGFHAPARRGRRRSPERGPGASWPICPKRCAACSASSNATHSTRPAPPPEARLALAGNLGVSFGSDASGDAIRAHRRRRARPLPHGLPGDPHRLRRLGLGLRSRAARSTAWG